MPKGVYKRREETLKKMSLAHKGKPAWNKGIPRSIETRKNISKSLTGRKMSEEQKRKISEYQKSHLNSGSFKKGHKMSIETRKKISLSHKGEKSNLWKGGITPIHTKIRGSMEYRLWRDAVFKRDNYTCIWCGDNKGNNLNADHIKPFAYFPELRFAIDNGRTLCESCHKTTDSWGKKCVKNYKLCD